MTDVIALILFYGAVGSIAYFLIKDIRKNQYTPNLDVWSLLIIMILIITIVAGTIIVLR